MCDPISIVVAGSLGLSLAGIYAYGFYACFEKRTSIYNENNENSRYQTFEA